MSHKNNSPVVIFWQKQAKRWGVPDGESAFAGVLEDAHGCKCMLAHIVYPLQEATHLSIQMCESAQEGTLTSCLERTGAGALHCKLHVRYFSSWVNGLHMMPAHLQLGTSSSGCFPLRGSPSEISFKKCLAVFAKPGQDNF